MVDPTLASSPSDFEAAAAVVAALKDLPKPRQELVLRWVSESLGIGTQPATPSPSPLASQTSLPTVGTQPPAHQHDVDIASFVKAKQPKTDIQFVTVVAFYHRFKAPDGQRRNTINVEVARDATRLADWDRLTNPRSTLHNAKTQGYLDSAGQGEFSLNTVGENLVARSLPGGSDSPTRKATKRAKKNSGAKKAGRKRKSAAKHK